MEVTTPTFVYANSTHDVIDSKQSQKQKRVVCNAECDSRITLLHLHNAPQVLFQAARLNTHATRWCFPSINSVLTRCIPRSPMLNIYELIHLMRIIIIIHQSCAPDHSRMISYSATDIMHTHHHIEWWCGWSWDKHPTIISIISRCYNSTVTCHVIFSWFISRMKCQHDDAAWSHIIRYMLDSASVALTSWRLASI